MTLARIKKGDMVQVISGHERGLDKVGKVLAVLREENRVLVEKINLVKRHVKPRKGAEQGGILEKEAPLPMSVVMPFCHKCNKGVRVRIKASKDRSKFRACASCGESLDVKR